MFIHKHNIMTHYVKIFDTTLRDGEQSPGFSMNRSEKIRLARQLENLGVDVIEAGFPAASPDDFESVRQIAQTLTKPEICGLARAMETDIKTTWDAIKEAQKPRIHTFIGTSPLHREYKLKKTPDQIVEMAVKGVSLAKSLCDRVDFSPEDAGRTERDFLVRIIDAAIEAGADTINIPDTVGYLSPDEFGDLIKHLIKEVKYSDKVIFATHCHNDLGMATANSLAGVKNGARQIECTINGCGERAGNASLEEVVMALKTRHDFYGFDTGIETTELFQTSQLLQQITGQKVQSNKAIVGRNAFAHEAGIHQHGILANRETYEIMTPESIGVAKTELVLGKHSGRAALADRLKKLGYTINDDQLNDVFESFKRLADSKKDISDGDLDVLMFEGNTELDEWQFVSFSTQSGEEILSSATITLKNSITGENHTQTLTGDGMVDAAYGCIKSICGDPGNLTEFTMDSVTAGIDAQAVVNVRIEHDGAFVFSGRAGDTDIVRASILAYLEAVNKSLRYQQRIEEV